MKSAHRFHGRPAAGPHSRLAARLPRPALVAWGVLACLVLAAVPALAQDTEEAVEDSSLANQMLQVLRPSYKSTYDINRQTTIWKQNFDFGTGFGFMNFNNKTAFEVRRDSNRDEDTRDGRNSTDLRWFVIPNVPLHMSVKLGRRSVVRPGSEYATDDSGLNLSARYKWEVLGFRHTVDVGGGTSSTSGLSVRGDARSERSDSGVNGTFYWKTNWDPFHFLGGEAWVREKRADKTLSTQTGDDPALEQPSSNTNRTIQTRVSFEPTDWLKADFLTADVSADEKESIVNAGVADFERKLNDRTSLTTNVKFTPSKNLDVGWKMISSTHALDLRVRPEQASSGTGDSWEGTIKTRWMGADIDGKLSHTEDLREPAISDTTDTERNTFEGKINKQLNRKFALKFDWQVRTNQIFYLTFDPEDRKDRDEFRTKLQPSLTYTPGNKWTVNTSYVRTITRRVELNPELARQTREDESFTVNFSINYNLSEATRLSQTYAIKADYTTYDFNPGGNRLLATQRISTTATSKITPKVELNMGHRFTLQDSGPFRFDDNGGRAFARSLRKYRQELTAKVTYQVTTWLTLTTDSRFLRTDDVNEASGSRGIFRDLQLNEGFSIAQNLAGGVLISATGSYVRSSTRDSYWTMQSSLSKDF